MIIITIHWRYLCPFSLDIIAHSLKSLCFFSAFFNYFSSIRFSYQRTFHHVLMWFCTWITIGRVCSMFQSITIITTDWLLWTVISYNWRVFLFFSLYFILCHWLEQLLITFSCCLVCCNRCGVWIVCRTIRCINKFWFLKLWIWQKWLSFLFDKVILSHAREWSLLFIIWIIRWTLIWIDN